MYRKAADAELKATDRTVAVLVSKVLAVRTTARATPPITDTYLSWQLMPCGEGGIRLPPRPTIDTMVASPVM